MLKDEIHCHHWEVPLYQINCVDLLTKPRFWLLFDYNKYITNIIHFFIMLIDFTEYELETIANAMDDYINYDDEKLDTESLFGGLSVSERVNSIQDKIDSILYN